MRLIVGLGNPGPKYEHTRHNIGFLALDEIAAEYRLPAWRNRFRSQATDGDRQGEKLLLLKPQTFMNLSGEAVGEALRFFKLKPADVLVLHDDLDLALGKLRVKQGGGNAGHNGLKSIEAHIGKDFWRLRIGIGRPAEKGQVLGYVLQDFAKAERPEVDAICRAIAAEFDRFLSEGPEAFMSRVAQRIAPPKPKKTAPGKAAETADPATPSKATAAAKARQDTES